MNHLIDENALAHLLKTSGKDVWQTAFTHYRTPFIEHFKPCTGLSAKKRQELFQEAFALFVQGLKEGLMRTPLQQTIFAYLIRIGQEQLTSLGGPLASSELPEKPFLAGETLVQLIHKGHSDTFCAVVNHYGGSICTILKGKYRYIKESPMEILGEALMAMKGNIEAGKLALPLRAPLFVYTLGIAGNLFLAFYYKMKKEAPPAFELEWDKVWEPTSEDEESSYKTFITTVWPVLARWLEEPHQSFEKLISTLSDPSKEILRLRFEMELRYKEIGEILKVPDGTARKRVKDTLQKWREIFFREYVLKQAGNPVKEYLRFYLVKRWPFTRIADHYKKPEKEIRRLIESYLQDWRNRYGRGEG